MQIKNPLASYANAIKGIESSGDYGVVGPLHKKYGNALGAYQIMEANLPEWSRAALGRTVSREEFLSNPSIQDQIFNHRFGGYVEKYGNPQDAASAWLTGRPLAKAANAADVFGTTGQAYVDKFNAALGDGASMAFNSNRTPALDAISAQTAYAEDPTQVSTADAGQQPAQEPQRRGLFGEGGFLDMSNPRTLMALQLIANGQAAPGQMLNGLPEIAAYGAKMKEQKRERSESDLAKNQTYAFLQAKSPELAEAVRSGALSPRDAYSQFLQQNDPAQQLKLKTAQQQYDMNARTIADADRQKNATRDWLQANAPELAGAVDSGLLTAADAFKLKTTPGEVKVVGKRLVKIMPDGTTTDITPAGAVAAPEFDVPNGYMLDPENPQRVKPIPGGPGEEMPGELAARIGLAENFLKEAPSIRERLIAGDVTGVYDRAMADVDSSDQAGVYRKLQSGTDALLRLLTGAGMNESEARAYAQRYLPSFKDDGASAAAKLDQLSAELRSAKDVAMRGRGGEAGSPAAGANSQENSSILQQAREAISKGAPRDAVLQRLRDNGIDPAGL